MIFKSELVGIAKPYEALALHMVIHAGVELDGLAGMFGALLSWVFWDIIAAWLLLPSLKYIDRVLHTVERPQRPRSSLSRVVVGTAFTLSDADAN